MWSLGVILYILLFGADPYEVVYPGFEVEQQPRPGPQQGITSIAFEEEVRDPQMKQRADGMEKMALAKNSFMGEYWKAWELISPQVEMLREKLFEQRVRVRSPSSNVNRVSCGKLCVIAECVHRRHDCRNFE